MSNLIMRMSRTPERDALAAEARKHHGDMGDGALIEAGLRLLAHDPTPAQLSFAPVATPPGVRLRNARLAAGIGQGRLGDLLGYSRSTINNCERGRAVPPDVWAWVEAKEATS